mmetsp:Transcript_89130/g.241779  ORF Transcript_89130/g.241779 Transcript_89130/m.241779 type:complete len:120 (+) Transcript_89130:207-566(+)
MVAKPCLVPAGVPRGVGCAGCVGVTGVDGGGGLLRRRSWGAPQPGAPEGCCGGRCTAPELTRSERQTVVVAERTSLPPAGSVVPCHGTDWTDGTATSGRACDPLLNPSWGCVPGDGAQW